MNKLKKIIMVILVIILGLPIYNVKADINNYGVIKTDYVPESISKKSSYYSRVKANASSSYYKSKVTSVKNQGIYSTCWAFSYLAMAETNMIKQHNAENSIDLSEGQLAYFMYHNVSDPLGNAANDKTKTIYSNYLDSGSNAYFASMVMSGYCGAVNESLARYESMNYNTKLNSSLAYSRNSVILKNAYFINGADINSMKNAIYSYGAVSANYYADNNYYNDDSAGYYCYDENDINHAVAIVGWNDNFNAFKKSPGKKGAWIVKNSWGKNEGDKGYIYISYYDKSLTNVVCSTFDNVSSYKNNYHYDGSASLDYKIAYDNTTISNIYSAKANINGEELLKAVSFALNSSDTNYEIQIYKNLKSNNPEKGTKALSSSIKGKTTYPGIYTIDLNQTVRLAQGEKYSIVIKLSKKNSYISYFVDSNYIENGIKFVNNASKNQSFYKKDGKWIDLYNCQGDYRDNQGNYRGGTHTTARIKALTNNSSTKTITTAAFTNYSSSYYYTGNTIKPSLKVTYGNKVLKLGSDYTVDYKNNKNIGTASMIIKGKGNYSGTQTISFKIVKKPVSKLTIKGITNKTYTGKTVKPSILVYNGKIKLKNKTDYTVSYGKNKNTGKATVTIKANSKSKYYSGSVTKTFYIVPKKPTISKLNSGKKYMTVRYSKVTGASGYQIYYRKKGSSQWSSTTTSSLSKKISKLTSKKTYEFKIRAYKTIGSKRYYGDFSSVKTCKVK